ncbi:MAG: hypothetical protein ACKPKO_23720 [Candidatus Fonsibacter sp.]
MEASKRRQKYGMPHEHLYNAILKEVGKLAQDTDKETMDIYLADIRKRGMEGLISDAKVCRFTKTANKDRIRLEINLKEQVTVHVLPVIHRVLIKHAEGFYAEGAPPPGEMEKLAQKLLDEREGKAEGTVYKSAHLELVA